MKITLVVSTMLAGGSQRVLSQMANYWVEVGYDVTLLTFNNTTASFYPLSSSVCRHALNIESSSNSWIEGVFKNLKRIYLLRKAIIESEPDCVISFVYTTNILVLLSTLFLRNPVIISERNDPRYSKEQCLAWFWLRRFIYPMADHLVVQNQENKKWLQRYNDSVHVIPNPVQIMPESLKYGPNVSLPHGKHIVAIGRLVRQKGFDMLIEIFQRLHKTHKDWNLLIVGTGPMEEDLRNQTKVLGVEKSVYYLGRVTDIFSLLRRSDIFVLSSRYEGFPNVLLEAMACGLPAVSFDCPSGPNEVIQHGFNGLLVPPEDLEAMEDTIHKLINDEALRNRMGREATKVCKRFAPEKIMIKWDELLRDIEQNA